MSTNLTVSDAAKILNISVQRVRTVCRSGDITAKMIGNTWFLDEASVKQYGLITSHTIAENHPGYNFNSSKPIALSFFSGAMGLDFGIEKAGFEIRLASEIDKFCRQTIEINKPNVALLSDINNYSATTIRQEAGLGPEDEIDLIVGGPPCQAFSTAGKRNGLNDNRGNIFLKYIELALALRPKYFVIENVRGLLSTPMSHRPHDQRGDEYPGLSEDELKGGALNFILNRLENSGYGYSFELYNAANFGTPQSRERVIIICSRDGTVPPYLTPSHSEKGEFGLPKWNTFKAAVRGINTCNHINFPEKRLKYYKLLKPGDNWRKLPENLQKMAMGNSYNSGGGKTGFFRRLAWDKPSPTLVTHPAMPATDLAHPEELRPLSIEEYKRLQQFPDSWTVAGPLIQQYKQIGNAVPTGLGLAVGRLIMNLINGTPIPSSNGFKYSRYKNTSHIEWKEQFQLSAKKHAEKLQLELI